MAEEPNFNNLLHRREVLRAQLKSGRTIVEGNICFIASTKSKIDEVQRELYKMGYKGQ